MADDTGDSMTLPDVTITPDDDQPTTPPSYEVGGALDQPPVYDQMAQARGTGYGWDEIDDHLARSRQDALDAGYGDREVDHFLGYDSGDTASSRFTAGWQTAFSSDPTIPAKAADQTAPDAPSPVDLNHPDMMADYSRALLAGDVKGPQDFADKYGRAYIAAYDAQNPEIASIQQQALGSQIQANVDKASQALAAQLPDIKELTDTSLGLATAAAGDPTAAMVGAVRENLMEKWAQTGVRPMQLYQQALSDPVLGAQLTSPTVTPSGTSAITSALGRVWQAGVAGEKLNWQGTGQDIADIAQIPGAMAQHGPIPAVLGVLGAAMAGGSEAFGKAGGTALLPLIAGAHQLISEVFDQHANTPEESADLARHFVNDVLPAIGIPEGGELAAGRAAAKVKVNLVDPLKEPGETVRQAPVEELAPQPVKLPAEKPATPGASETPVAPKPLGARLTEAEVSPAEALQTIAQDLMARPNAQPLKRMETMAIEAGADPATVELARGHDIAGAIYDTFHNLMVDQSGSLKSVFSTVEQQMEKAQRIAGRDYVQALVRQKAGLNEQQKAALWEKMEPYLAAVNKHMPAYDKQVRLGPAGNLADNPMHQMLQYVEGRSTGAYMDPNSPLKPVADILREVYENMRAQIEATIPDMTKFYEDYYRHQWQSPAAADRAFGVGKQGSGMSLRKRVIPTLAEGLERGLMPKYLNPIENTLNYINSMGNHLAARQVLNEAEKAGWIQYRIAGKQDLGMVPLTGLAATKAAGDSGMVMHAYASPGFATSYNNWLSKGVYNKPWLGKLYDRALYAANAMTGMKLLVPTYHALAMASESSIASIANGLGELARGELLRGLKDVGFGATILPSVIETMAKGRRVQQNYLKMLGDPVSSLFAEANGRAVGRQSIYKLGSTPSIFTSIAHRSLGIELRQDVQHIMGAAEEAPGVRAALLAPRIVGFVGKEFGRIMNTLTAPLFDHAIPWLKMGAFGHEMEAWLRQNPTADREAARAHARNLSDSMDNRFGELNQNNLFWPAAAKQIANVLLVSTGWEYGSLRAFGNAVGWDVDRMQAAWNPVAFRWALAFGVGASLQNSLYQYMRTGAMPWQTGTWIADLLNPRNGGQTPEKAPDRTILPGYQKDIFNLIKAFLTARDPFSLAQNLGGIATGKVNPFFQMMRTLLSGEDAIGHHIADMPIRGRKPEGFADTMHNYWEHVFKPAFEPIAVQNQGQKLKGTGLTPLESFLGMRAAPSWMVDPARYQHGLDVRDEKQKEEELRRSFYTSRRLETPDPDAPTQQQLNRQTPLVLQRDPATGKVIHGKAGPAFDRWGNHTRGPAAEPVKRDFYGMPVKRRRENHHE